MEDETAHKHNLSPRPGEKWPDNDTAGKVGSRFPRVAQPPWNDDRKNLEKFFFWEEEEAERP